MIYIMLPTYNNLSYIYNSSTNVADQQQPKTSNVLYPLLALAVPTITVLYNFSNLLLMIWEASLIFWKTLWELFINWPYFSSLKSVANKWDLLDPNGGKIESYTDIRDQIIVVSFLSICKNDGQILKRYIFRWQNLRNSTSLTSSRLITKWPDQTNYHFVRSKGSGYIDKI